MEVEIDVELPGEDALHAQARAQPALDQAAQRLAVAQIDLLAALRPHHLRLDFDADRHDELVAGFIQPEPDFLDRADLDAEEDHRRAHLQPVRRAFEIQHVLAVLAEPVVAGHQQNGHDGEHNCAENEGADEGRIRFLAHAVPLVRK